MLSERQTMYARLAILLGIAAVIGLGIYFVFLRGTPDVTPPGQEPVDDTTGGLPTSGEAGDRGTGADDQGTGTLPDSGAASPVADGGATIVQILTSSDVMSPTAINGSSIAYYDPADGRLYQINNRGEVEQLASAQFPEAERVTFATDASAAVLEFPDGSNVVYSIANGKQVTLPSYWEDFSFSVDGTQVAGKSIGTDPSNRSLVITATDGSSTTVVAALGENNDKVDVNWSPAGNIVAFSRTGGVQTGFGREEIYLIDQQGDVVGALIVEGAEFNAIWAPDGAHILYSVADASQDYQTTLWYADSRGDRHGDVRLNIDLSTTVDKCAFGDNSTVYCGSAREGANGDSLYRIDLPTGRVTLLGYPASQSEIWFPTLSSDRRTLYYQDEAGRLNSMQIR